MWLKACGKRKSYKNIRKNNGENIRILEIAGITIKIV